jgi:hypothetical protein
MRDPGCRRVFRRVFRRVVAAAVVAAALLALAPAARAVPPFARKYGMSCTTCHVGGPTKLTPFGEAFRDNGYRIPGDDASYLREPPMPLGAPSRAALFPRAVWPGELPSATPVGVAGVVGVNVTIPPASSSQTRSLTFPATAILLAAGSVGQHLAFFTAIEAGTAGVAVPQLFGVARSLLERWLGEETLNLKIGRMTFDLFTIQPRLGRSIIGPLPLTLAVGREGFTLAAPDEAAEIYGLIGGRVKWLAGIANGVKPTDDFGTRRDFFGRVSVKLGGTRLDYKHAQGDERWSLVLGAAAYGGVGVLVPTPPEPRLRNELVRVIGDARLRVLSFDVIAQAVLGRDSDPDGTGGAVLSAAWSAEADVSIFPWLQPYARYEEARFDAATHLDRRRVDVGVATFIRANVRFRFEGVVGIARDEPHLILADLFIAM